MSGLTPRLPRAVVLGAGTMGAQLACLLAGAGTRVTLLDLDAGVARGGLDRALKLRPSPVYRADEALARITTAGFEALPEAVEGAGWIIEAVVEQLEPKRKLLERVDAALVTRLGRDGTGWPIVSTNTSGISVAAISAGRSDAFRRAFLGTHFFNPPRYTRLLELVPTAETDPAQLAWLQAFGSRHLGKGSVVAKDTPAFIANRLGVHGMMVALALAQELGLGVDEVDELTGPLIGRPRSATFRTLDLVGLDVAVAVAEHCYADLPQDPEREAFAVPPLLRSMLERGALGEKTGGGFFRREGGEILALDLETGEYRPRRRVRSAAVEMVRTESDPRRRLAALVEADDTAGRYLRRLAVATLGYATTVAPEIADDAVSVDRAMRWGFGWEFGPFEALDALTPAWLAGQLRVAGRPVPPLLEAAETASATFLGEGTTATFPGLEPRPVPTTPGTLDVVELRPAAKTAGLPSNAAASIVELPEGILGLELHGKLNIIGTDTLTMLRRAIDLAAARYEGLVVGTRAADFSAGANVALVLMAAEEGEWDELSSGVRQFQGASQAIRYAPVLVAPRGRTLGGGAEFSLMAARRQPLAETYLGLVETGIGLIPAGGGSTRMARWAAERSAGSHADRFAFFEQALETMAYARVSTSAEEGRQLGFFEAGDLVSADPDRQWADAARVARLVAESGYRPPAPRPIAVVGRRGHAAAEALTYNQLAGRYLSPHDRKVVLELANVVSGGDVAEGTELDEAYLLDLEREAFLRLLGEPLTRDRIRYTLKTGKPLRN
jgi:3-hydroxyacyl-CoA dehydrogenase